MWSELPTEKKEKYKLLITNFASLSKVFSQKSSESNGNDITPIVNSKFQETAFQKAFDALSEDIANTSFDASIKLKNGKKYLIGIKSFGYSSGFQKIAQFKKDSKQNDWDLTLTTIKKNALGKKIHEANQLNENLYKSLAIKISKLRNIRIASSKAQIKGFNGQDKNIEATYHVLMPSNKSPTPQIFVGETSYLPIDTNRIKITGASKIDTPTNFTFTDEQHKYQYTSADSQLLMHFDNKNIVLETWDIKYLENPFTVFEDLHEFLDKKTEKLDSVSWMIPNKKGQLETSSGFNAFDGSSKLSEDIREERIKKIQNIYQSSIPKENLALIISSLREILSTSWSQSRNDINKRKALRSNLVQDVSNLKNPDLLKDIEKLVFRSATEMYIPIPESKNFHENRPDFFGKNIGTFKTKSSKLALPKDQRKFKLEFIPSGNVIESYINQDLGKAIQSIDNQDTLGKWILWEVFQLKERELLTLDKLNDIGINGIRLTKFKDEKRGIGLEFIWIDEENPPQDAIGWVAKNKKDA